MSETSGTKEGAGATPSMPSPAASGESGSVAEQAREKLEEGATVVQEKAQELKGSAGQRIRQELDVRSTDAGSKLQGTAVALRRSTEQLRQQGDVESAKAMSFVADRADRLGEYLTAANADRVLRDVEAFARRQPWVAALGGTAVGFLASRFLKASSSARYHGTSTQPGLPQAWQPATASGGQMLEVGHRQPTQPQPQPVGSRETAGVLASAPGGSDG